MLQLIKLLLSLFSGSSAKVEADNQPLIKTEEVKAPVPSKVKHINDGNCSKCEQIFNRYPGFHQGLKDWFKALQKEVPEAHISAAGRGKSEQEEYFKKGTSKAHYGQSAHNKSAAIDLFKLHQNGAEWPKSWFIGSIKPRLDIHNSSADFKIKWYGEPGSSFFELPHFEVADWKTNPRLVLVEPV